MPSLQAQIWLAKKLDKGLSVFAGDTTYEIRRMRMRQAIREKELGDCVVGRKDGHDITYSQAFERLWGEPL